VLRPLACLRAAMVFAATLFTIFSALAADAIAAGKRVAFVVGNSAYQSVPQLPNPKNDADLVSKTLRKQGFEVVTAIDLSRAETEGSVEQFIRALDGAEISLFYYSGHAIEVGGENRIIPVDARLNQPEELETQTYSLQTIMSAMQSKSKAQLLYLDACRDNPFADRAFLLGTDEGEKPAGKGLAEQTGGVGSLIAYATSPGTVAQDGTGNNSPFTDAVIRYSFTQDADVQSALMKVTEEVWNTTQQSQRPWINSSLVKPVFLQGLSKKYQSVDAPPFTKTLAQLQAEEPINELETGPVTIGSGEQAVFTAETGALLPDAKAYKIMQMPLSGSLSIEGEVLGEGAVVDIEKFRSLKYEPSTDVKVYRDTNTSALQVPSIVVETAAIRANGTAIPVQLRIKQNMHECDLLAAEPLDMQGVGKGVELEKIDVTQALAACRKAVELHPEKIRYVYLLGRAELAAGNKERALGLIKQAADGGYARAFHQLGVMYTLGIGVKIDLALATKFFEQSANLGDPFGLLAYGSNLIKGVGVKADVKLGFELLRRSAELGNTDAFDAMGTLYLYGGAVKPSAKRAAGYLDASITRSTKKLSRTQKVFGGNKNTATDLGKAYFKGEGITRSISQAAKWYEVGAGLGNQDGAADLSWIYANGPDELLNPTKAVWYTSLALASDSFPDKQELLQRLALLPDSAKAAAMRDFINLVGPCATQTTDSIDDTLQLMARRTWDFRNLEAEGPTGYDGSFGAPDGNGVADDLRYWNTVREADTDQAYLAYLENFPNGMFAETARTRLGGLLQWVANKEPQQCEAPKQEEPKQRNVKKPEVKKPEVKKPEVKKPPRRVEPVKVFEQPKIVERPRPKKPVVEKPQPKKPPREKPPSRKPPRVIVEEDPEEEVIIEREPDFEPQPPRRQPEVDLGDIIKQFKKKKKKQRPPLEDIQKPQRRPEQIDCRRFPELCGEEIPR
jgi:TPR repeat protein